MNSVTLLTEPLIPKRRRRRKQGFSVTESSEEQLLVLGCINNCPQSQKTLYDRCASKMLGVCLRYSSDFHSAEDILQEGFVKVFNKIHQYKSSGSIYSWIKRVMVNTAIDHHRRKNPDQHHLELDQAQQVADSGNIISNILADDLLKFVQRLAPKYRTVFNLHVIEGYCHNEIAQKLGITKGTSKSQLSRARVLLQEMVTEASTYERL